MDFYKYSVILVLCLFGLISSSSCHVLLCETLNQGKLKLTNESVSTIYKVIVDGSYKGEIGPDESIKIILSTGDHHQFELVSLNSGIDCGPYSVDIITCETTRLSCGFGKCSY